MDNCEKNEPRLPIHVTKLLGALAKKDCMAWEKNNKVPGKRNGRISGNSIISEEKKNIICRKKIRTTLKYSDFWWFAWKYCNYKLRLMPFEKTLTQEYFKLDKMFNKKEFWN